ncbi:unnamed protein product [Aphanomyces euteiches]|uniref:Glycine zipper domain-containing protein n=1 Tax=Aphanomyces euteiches TaxID=100861 RepID=A0A6G0XP65_9STRA|nr:hypothetical protein Ae201684_002980 [Aphanomyces euteiches]KAH9092865.1 hypothetical protein Ae201684P_008531 [Aphanomyces euteiches]KAH9142754.1 hypothetical protein AeRB84_013192 [Aphanomyces euteiches]
MRVLAPLALATSAVVALNLRGQDAPVESSNQEVAPMHSPDDLRILMDIQEGGSPRSPRQSNQRHRGPKETKYREKGGKWGAAAGAVALGVTGTVAGSLAGPVGAVGGLSGGIVAGGFGGQALGKAVGGAYGRRQDKKDQRKALRRSATIA